jgi:predicted nucleic acid-binding protein
VSLVVDASVALKWFLLEEPHASQALAVIQCGAGLIAPDLPIAELCNAAWRSATLGRLSLRRLRIFGQRDKLKAGRSKRT